MYNAGQHPGYSGHPATGNSFANYQSHRSNPRLQSSKPGWRRGRSTLKTKHGKKHWLPIEQ